ncbi:MAG: preprotein translocase subunit SecA [Hyphomicrobiaceae bacterium]
MVSIGAIAQKIFGSSNERRLKGYRRRIEEIGALEGEVSKLSDEALRARTEEFRKQVREGTSLEDILVPAFATVREAAKRALGMRHFDVQLVGGMVLHEGKISEMKTGEGKTLVATLPAYLNALTGRGVHIVTVNDYLARRDSEWMGKVYRFLGLSVGCIVHELDDNQRREQYACDITYGTNNEFGFDYLRDNMKMSAHEMVQFGGRPPELAGHYFAIVDEVDSILIDEARTPLIISGPVDDKSELYVQIDGLVKDLVAEHDKLESDLAKSHSREEMKELLKSQGLVDLDEKQRQVALTEAGSVRIEEMLRDAGMLEGESLYDVENVTLVHHVNQAVKAHKMFQRDKDYIVKDDQVVIIDEFTGRMMQGRRYSEGLHQALEAKEHVAIQPENQTLASITFQNFFRLYEKLSGMTGTAATEANEFMDIYGLDVLEIPTNVPVARHDLDDEVYRTAREKWNAIIQDIVSAQARQQPVLVGTVSIEKSETLSDMLKEKGIRHQVLNARFHEQEAQIIAQAGVPGAVTIATNMAGRGTDIQLGGNVDFRLDEWVKVCEKAGNPPTEAEIAKRRAEIKAEVERDKAIVMEASETLEVAPAKNGKVAKTVTFPGGLYVIGTERHESRRIDNQLRGRSGRQGDPGRTKFYLSLEDDLMRIFAADRIDGMLQKLGLEEGEAITHPWINKALENAQKKVEARNFDSRKHVLKYDDVMNDQRKVIFDQRLDIMATEDVSETITDMRHQLVEHLVAAHIPENAYAEQWDIDGLKSDVERIFGLDLPLKDWADEEGIADEEIRERLFREVDEKARGKASELGDEILKAYDGAKGMLAFVDKEAALKALLEREPSHESLAQIGRTILDANRGEISVSGGSMDDAYNQADHIGYSFLQQYMEARGLVSTIDAAPSRDPAEIGQLRLKDIEKSVLLQTLDHLWREHLVTLEHLRQVIHLRGYAQRDPLNEYKSEAFQLFEAMLAELREAVTTQLMGIAFTGDENPEMEAEPLPPMHAHHINPLTGEDEFALADAALTGPLGAASQAFEPETRSGPLKSRRSTSEVDPSDPSTWGRVARNDKCPCGSGKKYKHCHGRH